MTAEELKAQYQQQEDQLVALQAEKDEKLQAVWNDYREDVQHMRDETAALQKQWLDAEAAEALAGRADAESVADSLGLTLPE